MNKGFLKRAFTAVVGTALVTTVAASAVAKNINHDSAISQCAKQTLLQKTGGSSVFQDHGNGKFTARGNNHGITYTITNTMGNPNNIAFMVNQYGKTKTSIKSKYTYRTARGSQRTMKSSVGGVNLNITAGEIAKANLAQTEAIYSSCMYAFNTSNPKQYSKYNNLITSNQSTNPTPETYNPIKPKGRALVSHQINTNIY